jgi:hypothetical protein
MAYGMSIGIMLLEADRTFDRTLILTPLDAFLSLILSVFKD